MKLFFLFLLLPLLEMILFFELYEIIGMAYTISSIFATALIGTILVKQQARETIYQLQNNTSSLVFLLTNGMLILIAGILLLTPGFVTDTVGFLMLIPAVRNTAIKYLSKRLSQNEPEI